MRVIFQEVVGGARKLLCAYMYARECVKIFTVQKITEKNICQQHTLAKLAKIFSW